MILTQILALVNKFCSPQVLPGIIPHIGGGLNGMIKENQPSYGNTALLAEIINRDSFDNPPKA
jgi:hypothetical protein